MKKRKWIGAVLCLLAVLSLCYIFSNSLQPSQKAESKKSRVIEAVEIVIETITHKEIDLKSKVDGNVFAKIGHTVEYAGFSLLFCFAAFYLRGGKDEDSFSRLMFPCAFAAIADENLQGLFSGRNTRVTDVIIDLAACMMGYALALGLYGFCRKRAEKRRKKRDG